VTIQSPHALLLETDMKQVLALSRENDLQKGLLEAGSMDIPNCMISSDANVGGFRKCRSTRNPVFPP